VNRLPCSVGFHSDAAVARARQAEAAVWSVCAFVSPEERGEGVGGENDAPPRYRVCFCSSTLKPQTTPAAMSLEGTRVGTAEAALMEGTADPGATQTAASIPQRAGASRRLA
jgi:hypothetical protein